MCRHRSLFCVNWSKAVITNTADPLNNWQLFNGLDSNGYPTATWPVTPIYSIP